MIDLDGVVLCVLVCVTGLFEGVCGVWCFVVFVFFFFQAEDGIRDAQESRGLGDVYKRQYLYQTNHVDRCRNVK